MRKSNTEDTSARPDGDMVDPVGHTEDDRTGITGAPDPAVDDRDQAETADMAAHARLAEQRRKDPMGNTGVPRGLQIAGSWAWRLVALAAVAWVFLEILARTQLVVVPVAVALLLSALLQPMAGALVRRGLRPALATVLVLLGGVVVIGLLVWLVVDQFRNGFGDLSTQVDGGIDEIRDWLVTGPLGLSDTQIDNAIQSARDSLSENRSTLTTGAVGAATTAGHVLTGLLLALFATFFFLKDGGQIFGWFVRMFPADARHRVHGAGHRAWHTLISYVRATLAVAFVDAVGIGIGAAVLQVPLALPLAVVVFLGSFVPIIGATLSGLIAVLVALVAKGPITALILLGVVLAVQQLEGHVLQPLLLGRAVSVHPLAVVFAIATGVLLAGIVGALIAVPLVAVANTVMSYLSRQNRQLDPDDPAPEGDTSSTAVPTG